MRGGGGSSSGGSNSTTVIEPDPEPEPEPDPEPVTTTSPDPRKFKDNEPANDPINEPEPTVTTMDDPFESGKTGSEIMAEGGNPSAVVTMDPNAGSLEEKIAKDGLQSTVDKFQQLAHDGDDGATPTFDSVPNTEAGADAIRDAGGSFVEAAQNVAESNANGPSGVVPENMPAVPDFEGFEFGGGGGLGMAKALLVVGLAYAVARAFGG